MMIKTLAEYYLKKIFPNESFQYFGSGAKSTVFRSEQGKIVRFKPIWLLTYTEESNFLNFINKNGGIGYKVPDINAFIRLPFAISVHNDFGGEIANKESFNSLDSATQKSFIKQLSKSLISLHKIGKTSGAEKVFKKQDLNLLRKVKYAVFLSNKKMLNGWQKLRQAYLERELSLGPTHYDLQFQNKIIDDNFSLIGLIDFDRTPFKPLEYNLRRTARPVSNLIIDCWSEAGYEIDFTVLNYYRAECLLWRLTRFSKLIKRKNNEDSLRELKEILENPFCRHK